MTAQLLAERTGDSDLEDRRKSSASRLTRREHIAAKRLQVVYVELRRGGGIVLANP